MAHVRGGVPCAEGMLLVPSWPMAHVRRDMPCSATCWKLAVEREGGRGMGKEKEGRERCVQVACGAAR